MGRGSRMPSSAARSRYVRCVRARPCAAPARRVKSKHFHTRELNFRVMRQLSAHVRERMHSACAACFCVCAHARVCVHAWCVCDLARERVCAQADGRASSRVGRRSGERRPGACVRAWVHEFTMCMHFACADIATTLVCTQLMYAPGSTTRIKCPIDSCRNQKGWPLDDLINHAKDFKKKLVPEHRALHHALVSLPRSRILKLIREGGAGGSQQGPLGAHMERGFAPAPLNASTTWGRRVVVQVSPTSDDFSRSDFLEMVNKWSRGSLKHFNVDGLTVYTEWRSEEAARTAAQMLAQEDELKDVRMASATEDDDCCFMTARQKERRHEAQRLKKLRAAVASARTQDELATQTKLVRMEQALRRAEARAAESERALEAAKEQIHQHAEDRNLAERHLGEAQETIHQMHLQLAASSQANALALQQQQADADKLRRDVEQRLQQLALDQVQSDQHRAAMTELQHQLREAKLEARRCRSECEDAKQRAGASEVRAANAEERSVVLRHTSLPCDGVPSDPLVPTCPPA